ncbi:MAG: phytanoyl-CoA dioxygenase family protein [Proteobacteria bacterium]|nr:phytanoyl-CoA dioxygenase family protein [Pseudomonadota bacterium]
MLANTKRVLTEAQREQWAVDGYLQLEGALSPAEVAFFSDLLDNTVRPQKGYEPAPAIQRGHYEWKLPDQNKDAFMDRRDLLPYHPAFIDLIDRPAIFDLILDLMGPYIQFSMSQAIIRASTDMFPGYIHTDGGEAQKTIRVSETSRPLAVKVMYLLTDVTEPDSGNFTVFPGSHLRPFAERAERLPGPETPGTVPLLGKAGDAYVFPHAIWHGPSPNHSGKARKTILYNYCQMFVRAYDYSGPYTALFDRCTPRQRRLLGDLGHDFRPGDFFYAPLDQEAVMTGKA